MAISRTDNSTLGRWWWTVDRWTLAALLALIGLGYFMMLAASPAVAARVIGEGSRSFLLAKQVVFLGLAAGLMLAISLLPPAGIRRIAQIGCAFALVLTLATLAMPETKGARRWLALPVFGTMQPSEFLKPCLAVVSAWLLAAGKLDAARRATDGGLFGGVFQPRFLYPLSAFVLLAFCALILKLQPDFGMLMVVISVFLAQLFVAGLNMFVIAAALLAGCGLAVSAYFMLPHVKKRVDLFLNPESGDAFQITKSLQAFGNGGLFGRGPGEGTVKNSLPDAHADFVFAVAGEEFGFILCAFILALFCFVVVRGLLRLLAESDLFVVLAATGLLAQFGLQAFVNMASTLHLIPTKGMTLPFVSYGGSSVLAIALGMGMLLALTRRRGPRSELA